MSELTKLSNSLEQTLKDSDLQNVTISLAEVFTDSLMKDGVAKDIPIIGSVIGLGKTAIGIKESLFLKKVIYFICEIKSIPSVQRLEMINQINNSEKFRTKVGEKLLYIIDKCDDHEKSQIIAHLFSGFLLKTMTYEEFLRASHIVSQLIIDDLKWFIDNGWEKEDSWKYRDHSNYENGILNIDEVGSIATTGLFEIVSPEIMIRDQDDWKMTDKYIVEGAELSVCITDIGIKIKEILKDYFN
ncbi:MAG: hypothetical protein KZQ88_17775 [Candidatus Thiodiazotropha sp. (ex Dulcina madagascariensis)]|nr:hypothetical protein [Candidatus Thiodiazotropha sp. (ex Dulcina madagascariensis)]MCU7925973.1 hypothetical protein [Candidatus Thiodiazotropha sp. (ex Dulcina madagascariensis)]